MAKEGTEDAEAESKLAATKAGEPNAGPGPANPVSPKTQAAKPTTTKNGSTPKPSSAGAALLERAGVMTVDLNGGSFSGRADQFASFQTDAPACDNCGAITVRNGNCYLCHNCGNSMGCS